MADWRAIERIRKDARAFRSLARDLTDHSLDSLSEWEVTFLESIDRAVDRDEFTMRQAEKLLQIRDGIVRTETLPGGFSVRIVLDNVWQARADLSEAEERWIAFLRTESLTTVLAKDAGRVLKLAARLGLIEAVA